MNLTFFKANFYNRKAYLLLRILVVLDILFILGNILLSFLGNSKFGLDTSKYGMFYLDDHGLPEFFQYSKYILIIVTLFYLIYHKKIYNYISWLFLFIFIFFDDSLMIHESFGDLFKESFNFESMFGISVKVLGELSSSALFGLLFIILLILAYRKGDIEYRKTNIDLAILFGILVFFGIFIDLLHSIIGKYNIYLNKILFWTEEGGEMIAVSLIAWYLFFLVLQSERKNKYLYQYFYKNRNRSIEKYLKNILF